MTARSASGEVRLALVGFGGVGIAFAEVVAAAAPRLRARYGIVPVLSGIRTSSRETISSDGPLPAGGGTIPDGAWTPAGSFPDFLRTAGATTLVQCIPSGAGDAATAFEQVATALDAGLDVVTATKSHLVTRWAELDALGRSSGRRIRISAAAGAALPAVDLARRGVRGFDCGRLRASLNGTSNHVLNQMMDGRTVAEAIAYAQSVGIAEPDPSYDLSGQDAASKLVLIANLLWGEGRTLADVELSGIDAAADAKVERALAQGRRLRSIGLAERGGALGVALREVEATDAFYALPGAEKAVEFDCGDGGTVAVSGGRSSRQGAALAMLKDVVNLATGDAGVGFD